MKVLIVNALYPPTKVGGAERSVQVLAEGLLKEGHEPTVLAVSEGNGVLERQLNGVPVIEAGIRNIYWPFGGEVKPSWKKAIWHALDTYNPFMGNILADVVDSIHPDVVHTNNLIGFSVAAVRRSKQLGIPVVHTLRDYQLMCPGGRMYRNGVNCIDQCVSCRLYTEIRKEVVDKIDAVVGNSEFILQRHLSRGYFRNSKVKGVIFNGQTGGHIRSAQATSGEAGLNLGFLGALTPAKGIEYLLTALIDRNQIRGDWNLHIAGVGNSDYVKQLRRQYASEQVKFYGWLNPREFFRKINLLVVPSLWHDPLPRTIYEGYAHGVPVVATDRGGSPEIVQSGVTGYIFDPESETALVEILELIQERPSHLQALREGALKAAKAFAQARVVDDYLEVYREVSEHY